MGIAGRAAFWSVSTALLFLCAARGALAHTEPAQSAGAQTAPAQSNAVTPGGHTEAHLEGPWRFQIGDNPQWADSAFDDSGWPVVTLDKPLTELGFDSYAGYAWYRMRINARQMVPSGETLDLLLTTRNVGQIAVFANGTEIGHTQGFNGGPRMYMSLPLQVGLPAPAADGTISIAVRSWAAPGIQISRGLLDRVDIGAHHDVVERLATAVSQRWDREIIAELMLSFLFLFVAALGAILFLAQRHHSEYLWLALLCITVAFNGILQLLWQLAAISYSVYTPMNLWIGRIFMAVTLEFILRFTGMLHRRLIRVVQIAFLVFPVFNLLGVEQFYLILSATAEVLFLGLVIWLLFSAWRRGQREAGVMLLPFILAALADSIDTVLGYLAEKHWGVTEKMAYHRFHLGPIEATTSILSFAIFLASVIAVILYRFVRVSQEEQRSNAEIAAARSVQAMLIPTELPSTRNFMLESAYFPVNGVGGDYFQVLPVEDGSLLLVAGDVSGKGLQAAMNASTLVGAFRNELSKQPATILNHLNNVLIGAQSVPSRAKDKDAVVSFSTCLCARIYRDGTMEVANAGHLSPYLDGREMELPPGLPLGVIPGMTYEQVSFQLEQGVRIIFLSDGVVEAQNTSGELFGFERTQQVSNESARYIAQTAKRFGQTDDITVISVYISACDRQPAREDVVQAY